MSNPFEPFMQQAKVFQESLRKMQTEMQAELKSLKVTGEAGAGMVKITMDGHYQTESIEIDDEIYTEGKSMLIPLMIAANNDAVHKLKEMLESKMGRLSSNLGFPANFPFPFKP